jgi:cellulose synthase/poly-beta-1,6-N-acetylglucosamine synthase-like glycosyltransferase
MWDWLVDLDPFSGLPAPVQALFFIALLLSVVQLVLVLVLSIRGGHEQRRDSGTADEAHFLWVFLVPALNEEVTIADTVARLEQIQVANRRIVVIDDGSSDRTGAILADHPSADLQVLTRVLPDARKGKAAALNQAWSYVRTEIPPEVMDPFGEDRTLVVIVDADGRLDPDFGDDVASRFLDPHVGGVQLAVRIYNRAKALAYMQDVEFRVFGSVFQMGRSAWGSAGMGGNGQINRLSALTQIGLMNIAADEADGPWRHRLTEDQDLGLSLFATGWRGEQEMRHAVHQQGLSSYRRLLRQRVRWCQGNMQAIARVGVYRRATMAPNARLDGAYWLLQPIVQTIIGISTVTALALLVFTPDLVTPHWDVSVFVVLLVLGFGGTAVGVFRAELIAGQGNFLRAAVLVVPYVAYCWSLLPIYPAAWWRQLRRRDDWAKTAREAIG